MPPPVGASDSSGDPKNADDGKKNKKRTKKTEKEGAGTKKQKKPKKKKNDDDDDEPDSDHNPLAADDDDNDNDDDDAAGANGLDDGLGHFKPQSSSTGKKPAARTKVQKRPSCRSKRGDLGSEDGQDPSSHSHILCQDFLSETDLFFFCCLIPASIFIWYQ